MLDASRSRETAVSGVVLANELRVESFIPGYQYRARFPQDWAVRRLLMGVPVDFAVAPAGGVWACGNRCCRFGWLIVCEWLSPYPCSANTIRSFSEPARRTWRCTVVGNADGSWTGAMTMVPIGGFNASEYHEQQRGDHMGCGFTALQSASVFTGGETVEQHAARVRRESAARSKRMVKRQVRYRDMRTLVTFTNGADGGWVCRKEALDDVAEFLHIHGRKTFGNVGGVFVAERGSEGGRWHVHLCLPKLKKYVKFAKVIRKWSRFMKRRGHISTAPSGLHRWHFGDEQGRAKDGFTSARVAAMYLAKYVTKSVEGDYVKGEQVYRLWNLAAVPFMSLTADSVLLIRTALGIVDAELFRVVSKEGIFRALTFDVDVGHGLPLIDGCHITAGNRRIEYVDRDTGEITYVN